MDQQKIDNTEAVIARKYFLGDLHGHEQLLR